MIMEKFWYRPSLPLAVYRELAAQVGQVQGVVSVQIKYLPETATFDYDKSQVEGLTLTFDEHGSTEAEIAAILTHYKQR
ncbi:MAG: hypothetical protein EA366_03705 [Spirulina sp. DLM2.Bin59]|nr:MAG: hypothetical protein EA366_03705 [Spirulina sp. DLM2.Bin59]